MYFRKFRIINWIIESIWLKLACLKNEEGFFLLWYNFRKGMEGIEDFRIEKGFWDNRVDFRKYVKIRIWIWEFYFKLKKKMKKIWFVLVRKYR